jgi:hypothetical protein
MKRTTAEDLVQVLCPLISTFGLPEQFVTDNGPQFVSAEFRKFCDENGIRHIRSAPYRPQTNGEAERFVQTFKQAFRAMNGAAGSIDAKVESFLFRYRSTPHATTGRTPAELLFGRNFRTRFDLLRPSVRNRVQKSMYRQQRSHDKGTKYREFREGDTVWARWFVGTSKWRGGIIRRRNGPYSYDVQVGRDIVPRHVSQLLANKGGILDETHEQEEERLTAHAHATEVSVTSKSPQLVEQQEPKTTAVEVSTQATTPSQVEASPILVPIPVTAKEQPLTSQSRVNRERPRRNIKAPARFDEEFSGLGSTKSTNQSVTKPENL